MRTLVPLVVVLAACSTSGGGDAGSSDAAGGDAGHDAAADTGSPDTGTADTGAADTGSPDLGSTDLGSPDLGSPDLGIMCMGMETRMPSGLCDGRGMVGCNMWAVENAGTADAYAVCLQMGSGGCVRADHCDDATDPTTCTCGIEPACMPQQACARDAPTDPRPHCRCISVAPLP